MTIEELLQAMSEMINSKLEPINAKAGRIEHKVSNLDTRVKTIEAKADKVDKKLASIDLTLENETNRNMQLIAEGQALINRRLEEALRFESEKEMMLLKVNHLENEIRKMKERIEETT